MGLGLIGCGGAPIGVEPMPMPTPTPMPSPSPSLMPDEAEAFFDLSHLVTVDIEIAPADWDQLRAQTRTADVLFGAQCLAQPFEDPFTWFSATVTIDGQRFGPVALRKKGFLGSLSELKPSLKIKLTEFDPTLEYVGLENFTLNNSIQDPSYVRTCLAYRVHQRAGVPAPRCNYASVRLNGEPLGIYLNVETVKKPFLRRVFARPEGSLWEGTLSDFREGWMETFELKTSQPIGGPSARERLEQLTAALQLPDRDTMAALEGIIDVDEFLRYWAVESLVGHWDGYPGNANNFFVYDDPSLGRLKFMPWGPDAAFTSTATGDRARASVLAMSALPHRLYELSEGKQRYLDTVRSVMSTAFEESDLLARLDQAKTLIEAKIEPAAQPGFQAGIAWVQHFIRTRRSAVMREVTSGGAGVPIRLRDSICIVPVGDLDTVFETHFGTHPTDNALLTGTSTLGGTLDGHTLVQVQGGSASGFGVSPDDSGEVVILTISVLGPGDYALVYLVLPPMSFGPGDYPIDGTFVRGALLRLPPGATQFSLAGYFLRGSVHIEQGRTDLGAPIVGRVITPLYRF